MTLPDRTSHPRRRRLAGVVAGLALLVAPALAVASPASATDCGAVLVPAGGWLGGRGVDVHSNGADQGTGTSCGGSSRAVPSVQDGLGWQCVELAARLYAVKGWPEVHADGGPSAGAFRYGAKNIPEGSPGLQFHPNGSGWVPVPGDLVVETNGSWGHVSVVDRVTPTAVYAVEENADASGRHTYARAGSVLTGAYSGGAVRGVAHAPANTAPAGFGGVGDARYTGMDRLRPGATLARGSYLLSGDGTQLLVLQGDGNLVRYGRGGTWASGTAGRGADRLVMQGDGNLVLYAPSGPVWWTGTDGRGLSTLIVQGDGNAVVYGPAGATWWSGASGPGAGLAALGTARLGPSGAGSTALTAVGAGHYLQSPDGRYRYALQPDGELLLYGPGYHVLWAAGTAGRGGTRLVLQGDGNLVLYGAAGAVWASGTAGSGASTLAVADDGDVRLRDAHGTTWQTGTAGLV